MATDLLAMKESLRWEGADPKVHLKELSKFDEFNYWISEYFDTPAPAQNVLDALAILMGWSGDAKQIVTQITGQRHTEDKKFPEKFSKFQADLKAQQLTSLSLPQRELFHAKLTRSVNWQKYDPKTESYSARTPMNSYDVLKCSQACFHLFEWLRSLLPEEERPPRCVDIDMQVCDFMDGNQLVRRCEDVAEEPISPLLIQADLDDRQLDDDAEVGEWKYFVLDPKGVTLRSRPTYEKAAKLKARLEEGEVVEVLERQEGADTVFLRVEGRDGSTGWVFTTQPGPAPFLRLLEVEVKKCSLYFQVLATRGCPLRSRCSLVDAAKVGKAEAGQLLRVVSRLEVGGTHCFGLESGEWVVCPKDLEPPLKGPLEVRKMNNEEAEVQAEESVMLRKEPTDLPWAATKKVLLPKSKVLAIRRAHLQGEMWMEVMQLGGMSGWMPASDLQLEFSVSDLPRRSR